MMPTEGLNQRVSLHCRKGSSPAAGGAMSDRAPSHDAEKKTLSIASYQGAIQPAQTLGEMS